ncbi:TorF family putative porin [Pelomonas aquatica]|jgi:uncharacterized protein (TIGR02001 family)|uniref:Cellulose biosynthesis protein BcsS n=2 Tax=Pseudomonadota TaxID=1224 RepID=A0A9X4R3B0_9BURK|nr:TorF family putative porin [Pelomonas aquatica]MCY4753868.1 hypothetical protein [Pelomonas aquatica]MDG0861195.1 hypothetical protein [Pelomonas aquatica]
MPHARLACLTALTASLLAGAARADAGATLSLQSDARERGISYSGNRPSFQLGLAWDGEAGWYGGALLAWARFDDEHHGAWLRAYGGRVFALLPGLDGEAGLLLNRFENVSRYDFAEAYAGLLGERWNLRLHHSPDYYGSGQRSIYGEFNLRWPLGQDVSAFGHVGVLHGHGAALQAYVEAQGAVRVDQRMGASWQMGRGCELQLAWVAAGRGGPYTWTDPTRRRALVLSLSAAF